eukprot:TRINITY_DN4700_c0_g1_i19.p1 TRINITY_DN4700_c0_g1~~TRINITY_DN4700_c0_g1_i19.p1  ORF type:complete len:457 (+),score=120.03 TRINITY_DN4700_c0_g1_i19:41-1411(+)
MGIYNHRARIIRNKDNKNMLILLLILGFAVSSRISSVIFVTPAVNFDSALSTPFNGTLSPFGVRQSYLIGRDLREKYFEETRPNPENFKISTDSSPINSQTAQNIVQAFFLAGTGETVPKEIRSKAQPPIKGFGFDPFTKPIRDGSMIYHKKAWTIRSTFYENDQLFNPDRTCSTVYNKLLQSTVNCKENAASTKACDETAKFCGVKVQKAQDLCRCFDLYMSANSTKHKLESVPSKETVEFLRTRCDKHNSEALKDDVLKLMTEKLLNEFKDILKDKDKLALYVVSELQMKALLTSLSTEFPKALPKYGSMAVLERDFQGANTMALALNKKPMKIQGKDNIGYDEFVNWLNKKQLANFASTCYPVDNPKKDPSRSWIVFLIIGIVVAIGLAAGVLFFLFFLKKRREAANTEDPEIENREAINASVIDPLTEKEAKAEDSESFKSIMSKLEARKGR